MSPFTVDGFVKACKEAMSASGNPQQAARSLLLEMIEANDLEGLIATLEGAIPPGADIGEMVFHTSPELTLLYGRIPPRFQSGIHNHTVFACIAQLVGEEVNTIYERDPGAAGLQLVEQVRVRAGEVIDLPADVIHSIENPGQQGGSALHLYGGDFSAIMDRRSLWTSDTHEEQPFTFEALLRESARTMLRDGNRAGLDAMVRAIPASAPMVAALSGA